MATKDLTFRFVGIDAGAGREFERIGHKAEITRKSIDKLALGFAVASAGIVAASVKMAGDFQQQTNILVTAAGETQKNLGKIRDGILSVARDTGTAWQSLTEGEYQIEKAGIRGADSLKVLRAAAQGAREEGADLSTVTAGMTSVMAGYHISAAKSVQVMNALKTGAGEAKTSFELYVGSLSSVLPVAAKAGIGLDQVLGALSTMTQTGMSADQATQNLADLIRHLQVPTHQSAAAMQQFGLSVNDVQTNLGKRGLTGTLSLLVNTITKHMGKGGLVLQSSFKQSAAAANDVNRMVKTMPAGLQKVAKEYQAGTITQKAWRKELKGLPVDQANLARQFATLENHTRGFSDLLRSGSPAAQTFTQALRAMVGDSTGLQATLMLTGQSLPGFQQRVAAVGKSYKDNSKEVEGWKSTQKLFNVQMDRFKQSAQSAMITIGTRMLPVLTKLGDWFSKHSKLVSDVALSLGAIAAVKFTASRLNDLQKIIRGGVNLATGKGAGGGAAGALTGRGSPENPMFVVVMDKSRLHPNGGVGSKVKTIINDVKKDGPALTVAGALLKSRAGRLALRGATGAADIADPVLLASAFAGSDKGPKNSASLQREIQGLLGQFTVSGGRVYTSRGVPVTGAAAHAAVLGLVPQNMKTVTSRDAGNYLTRDAFGGRTMPDPKPAQKEIALLADALKSAASQGGQAVGDSLNRGVDKKIRAGLARAASSDARIAVAQIARNAAEAATTGGQTVGEALGNGVAVGILIHKAKVANAAGQLTNAALGKIRQLGDISSPSKKTTYLGQMLAAGLARGMHMGAKGVSDTARELMGTILGNFQASASLGNLSTSGTDRLGGPMSTPLTAAGIVAFLGGQRTQDRNVVRNLAMARKHGVGAGLLQQIAQMEPAQGAAYAAALARATPAQVRAINSDEKAIAQYGRQAGGLVTLSQRTIDQLSRGIAHSVRATPIHVSVSKLDRHNGVAVVISP